MKAKFRAYSKTHNKMWHVRSIDLDVGIMWLVKFGKDGAVEAAYPETFENIILMQSTGLKDMNGKEIYEGDIIVNHVGDVWVITYFRGAFRYYPIESYSKDKEKLFETDNIGNFGTEAFGVLGNVYENYELLEVTE